MGATHSKSFFGQNTGLIVNSSSKTDPYFFIRCIKKKPGGTWEKPSSGEGKVIKCSLDEIVMILEVLNRKQLNWNSYHTYKDNKTHISFGWEDELSKTLWINVANYSKMLSYAQTEILRLLLTHILKEKIKYATHANSGSVNSSPLNEPRSNNLNINDNSVNVSPLNELRSNNLNNNDNSVNASPLNEPRSNNFNNNDNSVNEKVPFIRNFNQTLLEQSIDNQFKKNKRFITESSSKNNLFKDMSNINGAIKGETEKALLIAFESGQEIWIPKSTIHCQYSPKKLFSQSFLIDNWILNRNKILA